MKNWDEQAEKIMIERFGKDTVIALATIEDEVPYVRYVNALRYMARLSCNLH